VYHVYRHTQLLDIWCFYLLLAICFGPYYAIIRLFWRHAFFSTLLLYNCNYIYTTNYTAIRDLLYVFSVYRLGWGSLQSLMGTFLLHAIGCGLLFLRSWAADTIVWLSGCISYIGWGSRFSRFDGVLVWGWCCTPGMCSVWVLAWSVTSLV
jgi:hypothetical protein